MLFREEQGSLKKVQKNRKFAKGLVHGFWSKNRRFFYSRFLGKSRLKRWFFNILDAIEDIKNIEKFANFLSKPWTNPFGKIPIFSTFLAPCFYILEKLFSFQNILEHIFLAYFPYIKKLEKLLIFDQNHGLTPLKKYTNFFDFFNLLFLQFRRTFFSFQNILKHIFLAYFAHNIKMEKLPVFDQNNGRTPLEKSQVFVFFNFLFLQRGKAFFFFLEYSQTHFPGLFCLY